MKVMKKAIVFILLVMPLLVMAQAGDSVGLEWCNRRAIEKYPLSLQRGLFSTAAADRISNLGVAFLPQLSLNGQATYQSDVTSIPVKLPFITIPEPDKDQYKLSLDINQSIYDGGQVKFQKKLEQKDLEYNQKNLDVELYKLKERIGLLYFGVIQLQMYDKVIRASIEDLTSKLDAIKAGIANGVQLEMNADIIEAEILKLKQQLEESDIQCKSHLEILAEYLDTTNLDAARFRIPDAQLPASVYQNKRFENDAFLLQKERLQISQDLSASRLLPKVSAFGQLGYGRPALNMLKSDFESYYLFGARLNWSFWNWDLTKREKKILKVQADLVDVQQQTFNLNLKIGQQKQLSEIKKLEKLLVSDAEIIAKRERISAVASAQMDNGVLTSSQYVTEKNNELVAKLNHAIHKIQFTKAKTDYLIQSGLY
jgi:outer membrane protein TolC